MPKNQFIKRLEALERRLKPAQVRITVGITQEDGSIKQIVWASIPERGYFSRRSGPSRSFKPYYLRPVE